MSLVITEDSSFNLLPGETLLEGLERHGHHVESQCRSGYCGSCATALLSGQVEYISEPLAFVANGDCLPCCCVPKDVIRVEARLLQSRERESKREAEDNLTFDF